MAVQRGPELFRAAFPGADLAELQEAVVELSDRGSPVVSALICVLDSEHWQQTRAAVHALRRNEPPAVAAAAALAGWIIVSAAGATEPAQQYTLNEALYGLRELRDALDFPPEPDLADACRQMARLLDDVFQPRLQGLLVSPARLWHRGVVQYLRGRRGDLEAVTAVLIRYLESLAGEPHDARHRDWFEYARAEALRLLADLQKPSPRLAGRGDPGGDLSVHLGFGVDVPVYPPPPLELLLPRAPRLDRSEVDRLLDVVASDPDAAVRAEALEVLGAAGAQGGRVLVVALQAATSDDLRERTAAVLLLAGLG